MDLTTFHNVSTVAITDQIDLHVNCLSEAPLSAGNTVWSVNDIVEYLTRYELKPGPITDVLSALVVLSLSCQFDVAPVIVCCVICFADSTWNKHMS